MTEENKKRLNRIGKSWFALRVAGIAPDDSLREGYFKNFSEDEIVECLKAIIESEPSKLDNNSFGYSGSEIIKIAKKELEKKENNRN